MLTMNVGHGQRPGSGAANVSNPARASGADRAADENRGQLTPVKTEHKPK